MQLTSVEFLQVFTPPWGGGPVNRYQVGGGKVTRIELEHGILLFTVGERRYAVAGHAYTATAAEGLDGVKCPRCGKQYPNTQGLSQHVKVCR